MSYCNRLSGMMVIFTFFPGLDTEKCLLSGGQLYQRRSSRERALSYPPREQVYGQYRTSCSLDRIPRSFPQFRGSGTFRWKSFLGRRRGRRGRMAGLLVVRLPGQLPGSRGVQLPQLPWSLEAGKATHC